MKLAILQRKGSNRVKLMVTQPQCSAIQTFAMACGLRNVWAGPGSSTLLEGWISMGANFAREMPLSMFCTYQELDSLARICML